MIVAFDTSTLIFLFNEDAPAPLLPGSKERVPDCPSRLRHLLATLQKAKAKIIIPAPALAELLSFARGDASEWLRVLSTSRHFRIAPFDTIAAVECAELARQRITGKRKHEASNRKAKFDEQIVAIARVEGASVIYSDDADIRKLATDELKVTGIAELPPPPIDAQGELLFDVDAGTTDPAVEEE